MAASPYPPRETSTPISNKMSGTQPYASSSFKQDDTTRFRLTEETKGLFLGNALSQWTQIPSLSHCSIGWALMILHSSYNCILYASVAV